MTRADNSALLALAELQNMERERSQRELERRQADQERRRQQQQQQQQLVREAQQREVAQQEADRVEAQRRRARHAAEARRRIEQAQARARAEQGARLAEVQRELSAELDRRETRRTLRLAVMGTGAALLASLVVVAVWLGTSPPAEPAGVVAERPDLDALSRRLERLHEDNAALRGDLRQIRAEAEAVAAHRSTPDEPAEAEAVAVPAEGAQRRPRRPRPRRRAATTGRPTPAPDNAEPTTSKRARPLVFGDSRDPLAGLEKAPQ